MRLHPRSETTDLRSAALLLVKRMHRDLVRMIGHADPLTVRIWEAIAEAERRPKAEP
jgi:hypothetical protein